MIIEPQLIDYDSILLKIHFDINSTKYIKPRLLRVIYILLYEYGIVILFNVKQLFVNYWIVPKTIISGSYCNKKLIILKNYRSNK